MDANFIVGLISDLILIGLLLYLSLFKSYFTEKGKNIATSEDIEDLTHKVENVKQQFIEKNANLKAKLDLLTNLKFSHRNDERLSLIEFHKIFKKWYLFLIRSSPLDFDDYENKNIILNEALMKEYYDETDTAREALKLYTNDDELFNLITNFRLAVMDGLIPNLNDFLINVKYNNIDMKQLKSDSLKPDMTSDEYNAKFDSLIEARKSYFEKYREGVKKGFMKVREDEKKYDNYIREHFLKISED